MKRKIKNTLKCILSSVLMLAMVLGEVPLPFMPGSMVVHAEGDTRTVEIEATDQTISDATAWENCTVNITGSGTVTYSKRITITGEVTLNLGEGVTLKASKGIAVNEGNSLTIEGTGSLQANNSGNDAAIGGDNNHSAGSITINSGSITTNNSGHAAGIGGGRGGSAGTITINGGNVNAHGGTQSAGIGGGAASQSGGDPGGGGTIIIRGGQIKATCDTRYASYIGCGIGPGKADGNVLGTEGTISLAWGNNTDYIDAYSYVGTICFEGGKKFFYDGTTEYVTSEGLYQKNKKIVPAIVDNSSLAFAEIRMSKSYVTDNGSEVDVSYEVYDSNDNKLTLGVDYSAVIKNSENTEVSVFNQWGDYTLTVTGIGNYHDSQSYVFSLAEWDKELTEDGSEHYINLPEYQSKTVYLNKNQCIKVYDSEGKDGALKVSDGRLIIHAPEGYALQVTGKTDAMKYNEVQALNINSLSAYEGEDLSYEIISLLTNSENISFASGGSTMLIRLNVASLQPGYTHYGLELNVTVVKAESHSITVADNINGGNIESNKTSAYTNDSVTLTVNPDMGYLLKRITVTDTSTGDTIKTIGEDQWFSGGDTVSLQMMNQDVTLTPEFTNDLTTNGLSTLNFAETGEREYVIPTGVQSFKIAGSPYRNSTTATNISTTIIRAQSGDILQATGNVDFYNTYSDRSKIEIYDGSNISAPLLKIIEGENKDVESIGTVNSSGDSLKFCLYEYGIYNMSFTGIIEVKHRHHFSYSSDGTTITAICDRSDCDLTDNKNTLTLVAPTGDLTYDGTAKAATLSGLDAFNATTCLGITTSDIKYAGRGNTAYAESTEAPTSAGTYTAGITVGGNTASVNYTISPKPVTITGLSIENKTYDGTTTAEVSGSATIEGKVENDDVRVAAGTAAFSDANAGTGKTVTFSGWSLAGAAKDNYNLAAQPDSVTADINKADTSITIVTSSYSKTYGDAAFTLTGITTTPADASLTYTVSDSKNAANESVDNNKVITVDENGKVTIIGAGSARITVALPESQNYNAAESKTIDVTVSKAANPVQVVETATVIKGGNTVDLSSNVSDAQGTVSYSITSALEGCIVDEDTGVFTSGNVTGDCTVTVTISGNENYNGTTAAITIAVTDKQVQTISFESNTQTKTYGDEDFTVTATRSVGDGAVSYAVTEGTDVATVDNAGKVHILKAGTAIIKATTAETNTYAVATAQYTLTVNPKSITIPTAVTGLKWTGAEQTGVSDGADYTVTDGKATDVGSYTATTALKDKTNTKWSNGSTDDQNISWSIAKADGPAAPTGLVGAAPTTNGDSDGKISGADSTMEYSGSSSFTSKTDCAGTEITGLSAGTYYVRVKETETHEAGDYATVKVPAYVAPTYEVTYKVVNGTWSDDSTTNKTEIVQSGSKPASVPTGMKAGSGYMGGAWDKDPVEATITGATTFTYTFTAKQAAIVKKAPTAKTLTYTGSAQELVTAGEATGGTMYYAATTENTAPADNIYTTSIPTATNAGTYYVWYKVVGNENYTDYNADTPIEVVIAKSDNIPKNLPDKMSVSQSVDKIEQGILDAFVGWKWAEGDIGKEIPEDGSVSANAIYGGSDKDNYNITEATVEVSRANHDHTGGKATCHEQAVCEICGQPYGGLDSTNHSGGTEIRDSKDVSCTEDGYTGDTYCLGCNTMIQKGTLIPAEGHVPAEAVKENEVTATCTTAGSYEEVVKCSVCGEEISRKTVTVPATGHNWDDWKVVKPATETEEGVEERVCKNDSSHKEARSIAKLEPKPATDNKDNPSAGNDTTTESPKPTEAPAAKGVTLEDASTKALYTLISDTGEEPAVEYKASESITDKKVIILDSVTINGVTYKITKIADNAFAKNKKIEKVVLSSNIKSIGNGAFSGCTRLKSVTIPANVIEISDKAFKGCTSLTGIKLGKGVTKIGASAFEGCKKLKSVTIGSKVTEIGNNAFANCPALTKVTIPVNVTKIGKNAFKGDKKLKTIIIKTTKLTSKNVSNNAFKGVGNKVTIKVPKKMKKTYTKLFRKKGLSKKVKIK